MPARPAGMRARIRPEESMDALMPVLAARTTGTRFSTARKQYCARCWAYSVLKWERPSDICQTNQPSLERLTSRSARF